MIGYCTRILLTSLDQVLPKEMIAAQLPLILPSLNDYLSKEWLDTRDKAVMADLAYESAAGRRRNRAEIIEKLKQKETHGKVAVALPAALSSKAHYRLMIIGLQEPASALQYRIIRLLGRLGGNNIHLIGAVNLTAAGTESGAKCKQIVLFVTADPPPHCRDGLGYRA